MKRSSRSPLPTAMIHHVKEMQMRLLATVLVLVGGMAIGYFFYDPLFHFIKAPLNGPLHYTSPAGSFNFVISICLMVGVIVALPVGVYNAIMFIQPALKKRLSVTRVYMTTFLSLIFASAGASFAFFVVIPMALKFFYKFQVDGLIALISADDYLHFVVNVIVTFVVIFQLPLLISVIDQATPIPPKKLLKAEKYIIIGSVAIGVLVPFALDPFIQLLIASPIIILYNISIGIVALQHQARKRQQQKQMKQNAEKIRPIVSSKIQRQPVVGSNEGQFSTLKNEANRRPQIAPTHTSISAEHRIRAISPPERRVRLITDIRRPARRTQQSTYNTPQSQSE